MGALAGSAVGALALFGTVAACSSHDTSHDGPSCGILIVYTPVAVAGGALIGAIIGHFVTTGGQAGVKVEP